jgi:DNA-binding transcriptional LysR family regulator
VRLTGAGHALVDRATGILQLLEAARADLDRLTGELAGPVRVGTVASAAAALVSAAATRLARQHPELDLRVSVAEPAASIEALIAGDLDLAVVDVYDGVPVAVPDYLQSVDLCTEPLVLVSAEGTFPSGEKVKLVDLVERDWVMPPAEAACGQAVRAACRRLGFEPRVRWETDDMLLLVRAVAQGHGVAVLPRLAVADDVAEVVIQPLDEPDMTRRLLALTRTSSSERPVIRAVLDELAGAAVTEQSAATA